MIRSQYPILLRLYTLVGSQWPSCFLNCGWLERERNYGFLLLNDGPPYEYSTFIRESHKMYLQILLTRHEATQVLTSTSVTPPDIHLPDTI